MKNLKIILLVAFIILPQSVFGIVGFGLNVIQDGTKLGASSYTEGSGLSEVTVESYEMDALPVGLGGYIFIDLLGWTVELEGNGAYGEYNFSFRNVVNQMEDIPFAWARASSALTVKKNVADFSIPLLAKTALSLAKSASSILDRAAVVNSLTFIRLDMVYSKRLCNAPRSARWDETCAIAVSIEVIAELAPELRSIAALAGPVALKISR